MTLVLCLNYGDKIYVATDSQVTIPEPSGRLYPIGYKLKLYAVPNLNAVVAFAGTMVTARHILEQIAHYAVNEEPTEEGLFEALPSIIHRTINSLEADLQCDIDLVFAGIAPHSRAYEQEKGPGIGIPPRTFCGKFSWRKDGDEHLQVQVGRAIHVRSRPGSKVVATDPRMLMDIFVAGYGAGEPDDTSKIAPTPQHYHYYYELRHNPPEFVMQIMGETLDRFFRELPVEVSGIGGEYQIALVTEQGIDWRLSIADGPFKRVRVEFKHDAYVVTDLDTKQSDFIQTIWDTRLPYEVKELVYLL